MPKQGKWLPTRTWQMKNKVCTKCGRSGQPYFPTNKARCKICLAEAQRNYRKSQSGLEAWRKNGRKWTLKKRYGLSPEDYERILIAQDYKCAICGFDPRLFPGPSKFRQLHVDHDHTNGRVRSLLCNGCNRALGLISENISTAKNIVAYLESNSCHI